LRGMDLRRKQRISWLTLTKIPGCCSDLLPDLVSSRH
jgi:hypothetical protein